MAATKATAPAQQDTTDAAVVEANAPVTDTLDTKGVADTSTDATAPVKTAPTEKTAKYVVSDGPIAPWGNLPPETPMSDEEAAAAKNRLYVDGEVVELTAEQAKHYVKLKRLTPYVEDDE